MLSRTAIRASKAPSMIASRGFRTSAARLSSPYHYPEGPRSNLPFNPLTKYFALRYWGTMGKPSESSIGRYSADRKTAFFFGLPFGVAGRILRSTQAWQDADRRFSLANEEEPLDRDGRLGLFRTGMDERLRGASRCICCGCMHAYVHIDSNGELHTSSRLHLDPSRRSCSLRTYLMRYSMNCLSIFSVLTAWRLIRIPS